MTLGRGSSVRMDLAAFRLDEIEEARPGVFRHRHGLRAALDRLRARWAAAWTRPNPEHLQRPADRA
ncbi:MAG: hypothetical protein AB1942_20005 [Pseudomonadota bacterium]